MKKFPALLLCCLMLCCIVGCDKQNEKQISSASTQTMNNVLNIADMDANMLTSATTTRAWKDQLGNRYYIIYLGRIQLAEIYNLEAFYYANDTDEIKITEETITTTTIMQSYRETITSTTEWSDRSYVENTLSVEAGVTYGIFSAGVSDAFKTGYETTTGGSFVEENEAIFTQVVSTTNRVMTEKSINCKRACTPGKYYRYSICGDVDCYMNLFVPADGSEATYEITSRLVDPNNTFDILFESDDYNSFSSHTKFSLEGLENLLLEEPEEMIDAYPEFTISATASSSMTTSALYEGGRTPEYDISKYFDTYYNAGYNRVKIEYSLYATGNLGNSKLRVSIRYNENSQSKIYGVTEAVGTDGKEITGSTDANLRLFKDSKTIYLNLKNDGILQIIDMNDIKITVTFYHVDK